MSKRARLAFVLLTIVVICATSLPAASVPASAGATAALLSEQRLVSAPPLAPADLVPATPAQPQQPVIVEREDGVRYVAGELIVRLTPGSAARLRQALAGRSWASAGLASFEALNRRHGARGTEPLFSTPPRASAARAVLSTIYRLGFPADADIPALAAEYAALPDVEWAEPDYLAHAAFTPDDPRYPDQWGLAKIEAGAAWDVTQGSPAVAIAIVDTGIDLDHPDLSGKLWVNPGEVSDNGVDDDGNGKVDDVNGWDWVNNDNDPQDDIGHGTHVAGIAAAATNNGTGVAGACPNCRVMALKVLDSAGQGTYSNVAAGITYAADKGARVINLSLGGYADSHLLRDAVAYASQYAVVVAAAGNDNKQDRFYPAAYDDHVVAVAATDNSEVISNNV